MFGIKLFRRRLSVISMPTVQAMNDLADRVHQRMRGMRTDSPLETMLAIAAEEAQQDADMAHLRQVLAAREQIHALPPRQRAAMLDHMDGLTYKQIAKRRGMTERIVLRDLVKGFATLRMRLIDERSNGESGRLQAAAGEQLAGVRGSAPHVGVDGGIRDTGAPGGRVPGSAAVQRPDESGEESGRDEPAASP